VDKVSRAAIAVALLNTFPVRDSPALSDDDSPALSDESQREHPGDEPLIKLRSEF
jgi:hypothetical protein